MRTIPAILPSRSRLAYVLTYAVLILAAIAYHHGRRQGPAAPGYQVQEVLPVAAQKLVEAGAVVVDVRSAEAFRYRHIPGAMLLTVAELNAGLIPAQLAAVKDRTIIVYCGDGLTQGPQGTQLLQRAGFARAVNLRGGIDGWEKAGLNIARG